LVDTFPHIIEVQSTGCDQNATTS